MVESVVEGEGLNLLINNAAIANVLGFFEVSKEDMMEHFEVNTVGPLLVSQVRNALHTDFQLNICYSINMQ